MEPSSTPPHGPRISYGHSREAWKGCRPLVEALASRPGVQRVCEPGGGSNPLLSSKFARDRGIEYVVLDASAEELAKAPPGHRTVLADIASPDLAAEGTYDLVFTRMVAEHVGDARTFHGNVHRLLRPGGIAFHFFPCLFAPPFLLNRLLPDALSSRLQSRLAPRDRRKHGKFPARYAWCLGPVPRQVRRFESLGFAVLEYRGFFGHGKYYRRIPLLERAHDWICRILVRHPVPWLASFAYVLLEKRAVVHSRPTLR
jgi:SAM-dependent methyltransferase